MVTPMVTPGVKPVVTPIVTPGVTRTRGEVDCGIMYEGEAVLGVLRPVGLGCRLELGLGFRLALRSGLLLGLGLRLGLALGVLRSEEWCLRSLYVCMVW